MKYAVYDVDRSRILRRYKTLRGMTDALLRQFGDDDYAQALGIDETGQGWILDEEGEPVEASGYSEG